MTKKMAENMAENTLFPDAAARRIILENLDENLVVEAAAGTGKTTSLVGRILNLFRTGRVNRISRLAAVTFTVKAAAELRGRLEEELDRSPDIDAEAAKAILPECHIGTIHSFCARLLRERPVEAGVPPDFREIEPGEDDLYRKRAWDEFSRRLMDGKRPGLRRAFELFGLDADTLGQGFNRFADFPDIGDWPGLDAGLDGIDREAFSRGLEDFTRRLDDLEPRLSEAESGRDTLIPVLQNLLRSRRRQTFQNIDIGAAFRLCRDLKAKPYQVQKQWKEQIGIDKDAAADEKDAYARFYEGTVLPFRNQCLAAVYAASLAAFGHARDIYDALRRGDGVLNFQDLLMRTAAVLRDFPEVREDLAGRYARLLVDETQDTDPVQAEIMFLLAADNPRERDWRKCVPRPGSLFVVGDPKQSIYRFRRADIVAYQEVKRRIIETGGRQAGLVTNFRSCPAILEWVNRTLSLETGPGADAPSARAVARSGKFSSEDSPYSPAYAPLEAGRSGAGEGWSGVYYLETIAPNKKEGVSEQDVIRDEALRIARFIRNAVDKGLPLPARNGTRPAKPDDFLIITYQKSKAPHYAAALRAAGVECAVSAGSAFADSPALALLLPYLDALLNPDDGIRLLAVLRGKLFGIADTELYRWKKAGGTFSFLDPVREPARDSVCDSADPAESTAPPADSPQSPVADAIRGMRDHHRLFSRDEPCSALAQVVADLGLWEYASLGDHPSESVGVLATALDLLALSRHELPTLGLLRERLLWLMENYDRDPVPARESAGRAVRIMNLHKAKGLEAPVVFLASTRTVRRKEASFAVRREREGARGALALYGGEYDNVLLARPAEWDEWAEEEELFLAAERTRLKYVAATRAGAALVVSVHRTAEGWRSAFLPEFQPGVTIADKLPEPEDEAGLPPVPETYAPPSPAVLRDCSNLLAPSYSLERAKQEKTVFADAPAESLPGETGSETGFEAGSADPEWASDAGEILHRLIDAGANRKPAALVEMAGDLLAEFNRPREAAEELAGFVLALRRSDLWRRMSESPKVYREIPFTVRLDRPEGVALQRGVIDLAFREEGGWVIVDYKSDKVAEGAAPETAAHKHAPQLAAYAEAWSRLTGETVVETGIYLLRSGEYAGISRNQRFP